MSEIKVDTIILGQGLAGSAVAWVLGSHGHNLAVISDESGPAASRISAGLIMPISGRRLAESPDFPQQLRIATQFYDDVGKVANQELLSPIEIRRHFFTKEERHEFEQRRLRLTTPIELWEDTEGQRSGFRMPGWRLNVPRYLKATRNWLVARHHTFDARLKTEDIKVAAEAIEIPHLGLQGRHIVFCQGADGTTNPWFPGVPDHPVRGDILHLKVGEKPRTEIDCHEYWLAPDFDHDRWLAGASYDRSELRPQCGLSASRSIREEAARLAGQPVSIIDAVSGIRAGMRNRRYVVGRHRQHPHMWIVNGLGSRGALLAPSAANELHDLQQKPETAVTKRGRSLTRLAHTAIRRVVSRDDWAIDATAGNGHDTLFLAEVFGSEHVIAVDIQEDAIRSAQSRLTGAGREGVCWIHGDHAEALESFLTLADDDRKRPGRTIAAVMFNLGYLPGSDHQITTRPERTLRAIKAAVQLVRPGGVVTVIAYRGHAGGAEEATAVQHLAETITRPVDQIEGTEGDPKSPVLVIIRC